MPPSSLRIITWRSLSRIQRGLSSSDGFVRGTVLLEIVRGCAAVPAGLAVPLSTHVNAAFWRLVSLALGAELELVRRVSAA